VLIPVGMTGVWLVAGLGFLVVLVCMAVSMVPPGDSSNKVLFEAKLFIGTLAAIALDWFCIGGERGKSALRRPGVRIPVDEVAHRYF